MSNLILVRHGETRWNLKNRFTGWVDIPLSELGILEASNTAKKLKNKKIDMAYTSKLSRAGETLLIILAKQNKTAIMEHISSKRKNWSKHTKFDKDEIPVISSDKLNDRYYGDLQGKEKEKIKKKFGEKKVFTWRRCWNCHPPNGESLKDVYARAVKYFKDEIQPKLKKNNILIVAHANTLRAIIKYIEKYPDDEIAHLDIPKATPLFYQYKKKFIAKNKHNFSRPLKW